MNVYKLCILYLLPAYEYAKTVRDPKSAMGVSEWEGTTLWSPRRVGVE